MLLAIHELGLGGVWLGEILKNRKEVERLIECPKELELMAVIAFGYPAERPQPPSRKPMASQIILNR